MDAIKWELIIVDNNSSDNTKDIALEVWNCNPVTNLKIVDEYNQGLMYARIAGIKYASYNYICFVDDDNHLFPDYLFRLPEIFDNHPNIGIIGGLSIATFDEGIIVPEWFKRFESSYAVGPRATTSGVMDKNGYVFGAGMSIRKDVWDKLVAMGYSPLLKGRTGNLLTSGEDTEMQLAYRLMGYDIYYSEELKFYHQMSLPRLQWNYLLDMKKGFGACDIYLGMYKVSIKWYTIRNLIRRFWWSEMVISIIIYFIKSIIFFPDSFFFKEGSFRTASLFHSCGKLKSMWLLKSDYNYKLKLIKKIKL